MKLKLEKFMFCMTLETIGLTQGFLGAFFHGFALLGLVGCMIFAILFKSSKDLQKQNFSDKILGNSLQVIILCIVLSAIVRINCMLLRGIKNNQHGKMRPWLIIHGLYIIVYVFIIYMMFGVHTGKIAHPAVIVLSIAVLAFYTYCCMAVYSLYENIKEKSHRDKVAKALAADSLVPTTNDIPEKPQIEMV